MILNMTGGGGGGGLNFKVVGGTTQPTGSENLIWVNTDTAITGWAFASTQPTTRSDGTALSGGEIWFLAGTVSQAPFNAVKKNGIWVYPSNCKQYVSGEWVTRLAKTYQNGEWIDWRYYLFDNGEQFASVTGGWSNAQLTIGDYPSFNNTVIGDTLSLRAAVDLTVSCATNSKIDLTRFSALKVIPSYAFEAWVGVASARTGKCVPPIAGSGSFTVGQVNSIDVSALTGEYYIFLAAAAVAARGLTVESIWLE